MLQGTVAVVVVAVEPSATDRDDPDGSSPVTELVAAVLRETAVPHRGRPLPAPIGEHILTFSAVPRAVAFAVDVHGAMRDRIPGWSIRIGVHAGELTHRGDEIFGAGLATARRLASLAPAGGTLVSLVVRDILGAAADHRMPAVDVGENAPAGGAFALLAGADASEPRAVTAVPNRLLRLLHEATSSSRLTLVLGPAGSGKTTAVRAAAELQSAVWLSIPSDGLRPPVLARELVGGLRIRVPGLPSALRELAGGLGSDDDDGRRARAEAFAASVAEPLTRLLPRDLLLVVDGADRLATSPTSVELIEALARNAPPSLHIVLVGREDPGLRMERLHAAGGTVVIDHDDLRLTDDELTALVAARLDRPPDDDQVRRIVAVAEGHPETAILASAPASGAHDLAGAGAAEIADLLVRRADDRSRTLLEALAAVGVATPELLERLAGTGVATTLASLVADGLVRPVGAEAAGLELGAAARTVVRIDEVDRRRRCIAAARHLREAGDVIGAIRVLRVAGERESCVDLVRSEGRHLLAEDGWPHVLDAIGDAALDPGLLFRGAPAEAEDPGDADLAATIGEAWRRAGDGRRALTWFEHASRGDEPIPAWLAWRIGVLLHFGGELDRARALYARVGPGGAGADRALVHAWSAAAAWMQSDIETCRVETERALELARSHHDEQALAATYTVRAMLAAVEGDRAANDRFYLRALEHAERAGDLLQLIRVRTNRGSRLLEEGEHVEALAELEVALRTADLTSAMPIQAMALSNRGQVLRRLGRLDESTADLAASHDIFERTGSRWVGYALGQLGELYLVRGERALAQAAFEEALAQCAPVHDTQGTVPALTGLALLHVGRDLTRARALAEEACEHPDALGHADALAALTEVALAQGDLDTARQANEEGLLVARQRRDRPALATHLELQARTIDDPDEGRSLLREARALWTRMGCPLETARTDVALAALPGADADTRGAAERAIVALRAHGARAWVDTAAGVLRELRAEAPSPLRVRVLGGFGVEREGVVVPDDEQPEGDARELLARLIVQRGQPPARERIASSLWPDDPDPLRRLAAAEERLTAVLGALTDGAPPLQGLELDRDRVASDLDAFSTEAERGLRAFRDGHDALAETHLTAAEGAYGGALLEGALPRGWITAARDDTTEAYLQVVVALVELAERRGDDHGAVRLLLRVVERDPYDEGAHLRLVSSLERAGRRGESRRRYRTYTARMQEIGVEPAPFPVVTVTPRG